MKDLEAKGIEPFGRRYDRTHKSGEIKALYEEKTKEEWLCLDYQIGSDEVGVGDFLLPMIVVAAFVKKEDIEILVENYSLKPMCDVMSLLPNRSQNAILGKAKLLGLKSYFYL